MKTFINTTITCLLMLCSSGVLGQERMTIKLADRDSVIQVFVKDIERVVFDVYHEPRPSNIALVDLGLPSGTKWSSVNYYSTADDGSQMTVFPWPDQDFVAQDWGLRYGEPWRMSSKADFDELIDPENTVWTFDSSRNGYSITSTNQEFSDELFLPCIVTEDGYDYGYYWLSDASSGTQDSGKYYWFYYINGTINQREYKEDAARTKKMAIRPVYGLLVTPKEVSFVTSVSVSNSTATVNVSYSGDVDCVDYFGLLLSDSKAGVQRMTASDDTVFRHNGTPGSAYTFTLTSQDAGEHWVMCYVSVDGVCQYGEPVSFVIDETKPYTENDKFPAPRYEEAIDLGLSSGVLWAPYNLGQKDASDVTNDSIYFGWGDPEGTEKRLNPAYYADGKFIQDIAGSEYDIATQQWHGEWRLPQCDDFNELYRECNFQFIPTPSPYGIAGYEVTNKVPSKSTEKLFLPLSGMCNYVNLSVESKGQVAFYWTSECPIDSRQAYRIRLSQSNGGFEPHERYWRHLVRPVWGPKHENSQSEPGPNPVDPTIDLSMQVKGYDADNTTAIPVDGVDLGLPSGVKWAQWNVGAMKYGDVGKYYAWAETSERYSYTLDNYLSDLKFKNVSDTLDSDHDVAKALWQDDWRMPTQADIAELLDEEGHYTTADGTDTIVYRHVYVRWETAEVDGQMIEGMRIISKSNGKSIFLQAGGNRGNAVEPVAFNRYGQYWTADGAQLTGKETTHAWELFFYNPINQTDHVRLNPYERFVGCLVRPVKGSIPLLSRKEH